MPRLGERAAALDGAQRVAAAELVERRRRRVERGARDDALGQVVQPLEALPPGDRELARGEEMLERALLGLPAPHRLAPPLERAHRQRALARGSAPSTRRSTLRPSAVRSRPHQCAILQLHHPPLEQRVVLDRQQARLVRPVLEAAALAEQPRDVGLVVRADPRRERDPVRAIDRRDRVELHRLQPADRGRDVVGAGAAEARRVALVRDDVAPQRRDAHRGHGTV